MGVRNLLTGAGAVVGSFFGQPQLGLAIGSLVGNLVDPQRIKGPALKEFPVLGVTEGAYRQVAYGTTIIRDCQLIDWGPLDPVIVEEQQGKGGGPVVETQRLYQTYAVAIGEPIEAVRYIKRDGVMVYDLRPGSAILPESADFAGRLRIYLGDEAQLPDPDLEALPNNGVGETPSYRGTSYFVVVRDDLTDSGGRIPTHEVEVLKTAPPPSSDGVTLVTNRDYYSGPANGLALGNSMGWTTAPTGVAVSPNGLYACGFVNNTAAAARFQIRKYDRDTDTWSALAAPAVMPVGGSGVTYGYGWSPDSTYFIVTVFTGTPNNLILYKRTGDTFTALAAPVDPLPNNGGYAVVWDSAGSRVALGNGNSGNPVVVWDFIGEALVNRRFSTSGSTMGGAAFSANFQEGSAGRYLVTGNDNGVTVWDTSANPMPIADQTATNIQENFGRHGVWWNAANDYIVAIANAAGVNFDPIRIYSWDQSTETLTFVQEADDQFASNGANTDLTADRRWLVVPRTNSPTPWLFDMNTLPDIQRITDPPAASGNLNSAVWTFVPPLPTIDDSAILLSDIVADIADRCGIPAAKLDLAELTDEVKGLTLGGQYDGAGAITTLMPPYFFDLYEADKQIHAPKRGGAAVLTVPEADLIEEPDENSLRGQDIEYPRKLQLKYLNPAQNYAAPAAVFARTTPDIRVRGEANMDLPICFDETQAIQVAERVLKVMWEDLNGEVTFSLPAGPYAWLSPTDCLGLSIRGALYRIRVEKVEDIDGVLKVTARRDRQSAYTSVLTALPLPPPAGPPPSLAGVTQFVVLNAPGVIDSDDQLGVRIGVCGLPGTAWSGATVRYSTDAGASWTTAATIRTAARLGTLTAALPAALAGYTDATNPLRVLLIGDRQLEAVTDLQLLQEGNGAAIANPDGTCEVIQFRDVVDEGSRAWTLRHLPRGGLATEADLHAIAAKFVMLDGTEFVPLPSALIGTTLRFQFVSLGTSPETAPIFDLVWNPAVAQSEFPPASLRLTRGSGVISATWAPRHRFGIDTGPVASVNFTGWRITLTAGLVTQVFNLVNPSYSGSDAAFTGAITVTVQQLNRFTGAGPGTSGII